MKKIIYLSFILCFISCAASEEDLKPKPGRCENNAQCKEGEKCNRTFCEDIYHPRRDIKNY